MDVEDDIRAPTMLVAMPQLLDPFFHRSLVLLVHHDEEGSLGFIVNRVTAIKVAEILQGMEIAWEGDPESVAAFGGPVQPQLGTVVLGPDAESASPAHAAHVMQGIVITQHIDDLTALALLPPTQFRLLLGYAGWGPGQLMDEIMRNDWLIVPAQPELVFVDEPEKSWDLAIRSVGIQPDSLPSWSPAAGEESTN